MSSLSACSYTPPPPPPGKSAEALPTVLQSLDHPASATPLPPATTTTPSTPTNHPTPISPQIRYCYFISAASASTSRSRNPSLSRKPVYLEPLAQDPMDTSPNCTQPRPLSRQTRDRNSKDVPSSSYFLLGPHPPQIQLQFLENEPLPPPTPFEPSALAETLSSKRATLHTLESSDVVLVERKDSGYGGSISRSSSLAAFGRGIRKVFWRTSSKGSVESVVVTDPPVLDCDIPQDVLDHEGWALDLAEKLTLASDPDAVSTWLGQLPSETVTMARPMTLDSLSVPAMSTSFAVSVDHPRTGLGAVMEAHASATSIYEFEEEFHFDIPRTFGPQTLPVPVPSPVPVVSIEESSKVGSLSESAVSVTVTRSSSPSAALSSPLAYPSPPISPAAALIATSPSTKELRPSSSIEILNKPQPPLPQDSGASRSSGSSPAQAGRNSGSSSLSSLSSLARKFSVADFGFKRTSEKRNTLQPQRQSVQHYFQESASEIALSPAKTKQPSSGAMARPLRNETTHRSLSVENLLDIKSKPLVTSPEELDGPSYLQAKPLSKRSHNFFKSLTYSSGTNVKATVRQPDTRPVSEVLLSNSNLTPEEISAEVALASCNSSFRSPTLRKAIPQWTEELGAQSPTPATVLSPPEPLFYNKSRFSSASSLNEGSSCGSMDSLGADSSADEWDGVSRMNRHAHEQNSRYSSGLKDLRAMLHQVEGAPVRPYAYSNHSANTSAGSLSITSVPSSPSRKDKPTKSGHKKDDYMSHRMSGLSPMLMPVHGKTKPRSKSRLSMTYGGGELEVVKQAKFDTPEAIARNKEIRKFISQEIYTTELNYLQYLRTIQEVFVQPLMRSFETDKPFIPRTNALFVLLSHIGTLADVSSQLAQRLESCVSTEAWSDDTSLVGTVFLDAKEPLCIFLKYGQVYGKGMKALRALMKTKRSSIPVPPIAPSGAPLNLLVPGGPRMDKRRSLPSVFALNGAVAADSSARSIEAGTMRMSSKPRSSHGSLMLKETSDFERFIQNCAGNKEMTSRFSLADLLILPIQRVTRYCLLLKDLKRHTGVDHQDYVGLVHALEQVHTLAMATNNVQPTSLRL